LNWGELKNLILFPFRVICDHEKVTSLGLMSLRDERFGICFKYCKGKVLDVGCGEGNRFIKKYKNGIGIDRYAWEGIDMVCDAEEMPFAQETFNTVLFIGSINHVLDRRKAIKEAYRVLKKEGRILITMINPIIGFARHKLAWWDKDQCVRGMRRGESWGLWSSEIIKMLHEANFISIRRVPFLYGLNNLLIAEK